MKIYTLGLLISLCTIAHSYQANAQENELLPYQSKLYFQTGIGLTMPAFGSANEGPIHNGFLPNVAFNPVKITWHFLPKYNLSFNLGYWQYNYNSQNFKQYVENQGFTVGNSNIDGSIRHFASQVVISKIVHQSEKNSIEIGTSFGIGYKKMTNIHFISAKENNSYYVGNGTPYDLFTINYFGAKRRSPKINYGLQIKYAHFYNKTAGVFFAFEINRFANSATLGPAGFSHDKGKYAVLAGRVGFIGRL